MYHAVRQTAEDNTPDTYLPMEGAGKKLLAQRDEKVAAVNQLGAAGNDGEAGAKGAENGEVGGVEGADAVGAETGESSGDKGPQVKSNADEDNEATPLLKQRKS